MVWFWDIHGHMIGQTIWTSDQHSDAIRNPDVFNHLIWIALQIWTIWHKDKSGIQIPAILIKKGIKN